MAVLYWSAGRRRVAVVAATVATTTTTALLCGESLTGGASCEAPSTLRDFLLQSVQEAEVGAGLRPAPAKYWVVMGNQAADADSIITAITMAYLTKRKLCVLCCQPVPRASH